MGSSRFGVWGLGSSHGRGSSNNNSSRNIITSNNSNNRKSNNANGLGFGVWGLGPSESEERVHTRFWKGSTSASRGGMAVALPIVEAASTLRVQGEYLECKVGG